MASTSRSLASSAATASSARRAHTSPARKSGSALARAAARHGGVDVSTSVDGPHVSIEPVVAAAAPVVLGEEQKDLAAAVAVRVLSALGAELTLEGERLTVTLPT